MANHKPKACAMCGMEFTPRSGNSKYCTTECYKRSKKESDKRFKEAHPTYNRNRKRKRTEEQKAHDKAAWQDWYKANKSRITDKQRQWRHENPQKAREKDRRRYAANPEKKRQKDKRSYAKNKWKYTERRQQHYRANKERIREKNRDWYRNNYERHMENSRRWRANNPDKIASWLSARARAELEGNATPKLIEAKWEASNKTRILCGEPIDPTLKAPHNMSRTLEHLTPIARGGRHDIDNIDFAHWRRNASKGTKTLDEYRE